MWRRHSRPFFRFRGNGSRSRSVSGAISENGSLIFKGSFGECDRRFRLPVAAETNNLRRESIKRFSRSAGRQKAGEVAGGRTRDPRSAFAPRGNEAKSVSASRRELPSVSSADCGDDVRGCHVGRVGGGRMTPCAARVDAVWLWGWGVGGVAGGNGSPLSQNGQLHIWERKFSIGQMEFPLFAHANDETPPRPRWKAIANGLWSRGRMLQGRHPFGYANVIRSFSPYMEDGDCRKGQQHRLFLRTGTRNRSF